MEQQRCYLSDKISTEKLQYLKRHLTLPRAHSLPCPSFPFAKLLVIHKLIAFILGLGCKIVALSCEDVICFLLALESVIWHPHIDSAFKK